MRFLLILTYFFFSFGMLAQQIEISGTIVDVDGQPVPRAKCYFSKSPAKKEIANNDGEYTIKLKSGTFDTLNFEAYGFGEYQVFIDERMQKKARKTGQIKLDIILPEKTLNIVYIGLDLPDTICCGQEYSIEDFAFHPSGYLIMLTYEKNIKSGSQLRLFSFEDGVVDTYYLSADDESIELRNDFRGGVHLITENNVFYITVNNARMSVYHESREYYFKYIEPVIDTIGTNIYFSNYSDIYPAFDYFEFNIPDSAYQTLISVADGETMEFYRAEFKYLDNRTKVDLHNRELETGIDKEIWAGAMFFSKSIYYDPIYAPLFKVGTDSLVIFDHYKNLMFKYSPEFGFMDSVRISYHKESKKSGWEQPLIQDKVNGKIYAIFSRSGYTYLSEIDQNTGDVKQSFKLYFKYIERIQIVDDQIYYIYRPFESVQKKYIYREKIKS